MLLDTKTQYIGRKLSVAKKKGHIIVKVKKKSYISTLTEVIII